MPTLVMTALPKGNFDRPAAPRPREAVSQPVSQRIGPTRKRGRILSRFLLLSNSSSLPSRSFSASSRSSRPTALSGFLSSSVILAFARSAPPSSTTRKAMSTVSWGMNLPQRIRPLRPGVSARAMATALPTKCVIVTFSPVASRTSAMYFSAGSALSVSLP